MKSCKICIIDFDNEQDFEIHNADFHPMVTICQECNNQILDLDDSYYHLENCMLKKNNETNALAFKTYTDFNDHDSDECLENLLKNLRFYK